MYQAGHDAVAVHHGDGEQQAESLPTCLSRSILPGAPAPPTVFVADMGKGAPHGPQSEVL